MCRSLTCWLTDNYFEWTKESKSLSGTCYKSHFGEDGMYNKAVVHVHTAFFCGDGRKLPYERKGTGGI